jgi:hypothetical protein
MLQENGRIAAMGLSWQHVDMIIIVTWKEASPYGVKKD